MPVLHLKVEATTEQSFLGVFCHFITPEKHRVKMVGSSNSKLTGEASVIISGRLVGVIKVVAAKGVEYKLKITRKDNEKLLFEAPGTVGESLISRRNVNVDPS
ncbi:hypothetical protein [uncultured Imperialibacter sp.]|uniref:hypothetical protein n=1 Tax=uncultured Imperialibacter sp. TaxID=1672639 RepID=UPI0030DC782B|tara:strand:- start:54112 stop:54420 length:309 start_codon:yes stop_codon:yes gene_type:complete